MNMFKNEHHSQIKTHWDCYPEYGLEQCNVLCHTLSLTLEVSPWLLGSSGSLSTGRDPEPLKLMAELFTNSQKLGQKNAHLSFCWNCVREWKQWYWMQRWCCFSQETGRKPQACFTQPSNNLQMKRVISCYHCQFRAKWLYIPLLINCFPPPLPSVNANVLNSLQKIEVSKKFSLGGFTASTSRPQDTTVG